MTKEIKIYVYGSCHFSERLENDDAVGTGGYGIVITENGRQIEQVSAGFSFTTNARMDIIGITEGLKKIKEPSKIIIYLSNGYVIDTLTKGWLENWKRKGFKKKKHVDLWKELDKVLQQNIHTISYKHSKDVKYSKDFQLAEQLGKEMSGKRNLPNDLKQNDNGTGLFGEADQTKSDVLEIEDDTPILDSICVDASTIENPGVTEYRGVDTITKQVIFQHKYDEATNNIGEFLAIVHALALYKKQNKELKIIYSDSVNAISWVRQKKCKTKYEQTESNAKLFDDIKRAVAWLENNEYETKILKWNTVAWGQIPADYGRK
jgi:ribonuclease HI